ncbi:hypothetical protein AJ79_07626 [Helicocarpus griseus UAMH5409]|uniref:3-hydroxyisobutyrate dehydrogenase n=1 Tax=Helicocarpus griseus UAMH5409 TaxID=1447875 RepID=A0A2B7X147_9EURO|nr:hypothetical protein AJ79_07626 [Helicocarpus griseus UAMH5409]
MSTTTALECKNLGFIGIGAMGRPMVENLAHKLPTDAQIHIFDVLEQAVIELCAQYPKRILKATSARDVTEKSSIVLTMLPESPHVRTVYLDPTDGISSHPPLFTPSSPKLLIDSSTIDTATHLSIKQHLTTTLPPSSFTFYDAPVSGGVPGAINSTIAFFLGCAATDPNLPLLTTLTSLMGKQIIPCGGASLGLAAKLSNNYLSGVIAIACSEAMNMGMRAGIDPRVLADVYAAGTAQNAICDRFNPVPGVREGSPANHGYRGGFRVQLMKKDFGLAVQMAERVGAKLVLGEAGLKTYEGASGDERCEGLDSRVVYRYLGGEEEWEGKIGE